MHCVHVCCRIVFGWQRCDLWWVFAAQFSLCLVHTGGKQPASACIKAQHISRWPYCIQKYEGGVLPWLRKTTQHLFGCLHVVMTEKVLFDNTVCDFSPHLSEFHRLVFSQWKMWHIGYLTRKGMQQETARVPCFQRPRSAGSPTRKEYGQQYSDLAAENGSKAATWYLTPRMLWFICFWNGIKLLLIFSCRQSGDFPGQGSTHRGLSCGPLLPDGPVSIHGWRPEQD